MTGSEFWTGGEIMGFWGWAIQIIGLAVDLYQLWTG